MAELHQTAMLGWFMHQAFRKENSISRLSPNPQIGFTLLFPLAPWLRLLVGMH